MTTVVHITKEGEATQVFTFMHGNVNHQKNLLLLLHRIANGEIAGQQITISQDE